MAMEPSRRATLKAGVVTGAVALFGFGLAHMVWITPLVEREPDVPLAALLAVMVGAPMLVGAVPTLLASLLLALAWRCARVRLPSWRFGALLAAGFLPVFVGAAVVGGSDEAAPQGAVLAVVWGTATLVLGGVGAWAGGWRAALLLPTALAPVLAVVTMFFLSIGLNAWTTGFAASILAVLTLSGWVVERLAERFARREATLPPSA